MKSFFGGRRKPSWKISLARGEMLAGTSPPMSEQWRNPAPWAISRPSQKIGRTRWRSGRWVAAASELYGSLVMMTSPCPSGPASSIVRA